MLKCFNTCRKTQLLTELPSKMATSATKALCNYLMSKNVMHFK